MPFKKSSLVTILAFFLIGMGCSKDTPTKYDLTITVTPANGGKTSVGSGTFNEGQQVSTIATPSEGFYFQKWEGDVQNSDNPLTFTMTSDKKLTAVFSKNDADEDGVTDDIDECDDTPKGEAVNEQGCSDSQKDEDGDGIDDATDLCPETISGETVDENGCSQGQKDADGDGVTDDTDQCPDTPTGSEVNEFGCLEGQADGDNDGVLNDDDQCPNTPEGETVDANGCSDSQKDSDGDGIFDNIDECEDTPEGVEVNELGCSSGQTDSDEDGVTDDLDTCTETPMGEEVNAEGCSPSQIDTDGDGVNDSEDQCAETPNGETVDATGCSESQTDKSAPEVDSYEVKNITQTSFTVDWNLNEGSKGYIRFGTSPGIYVGSTAISNDFLTRHQQTVGGNNPFELNAGTTYYFQIYTEDQYGNTGFSEEYSTETLAEVTQRPFIFRHSPQSDLTIPYSIGIATDPNLTYNYTVDWGDGIIETNVTGDISHDYIIPDDIYEPYYVKITGIYPKPFYDKSGYNFRRISTTIKQWGDIEWTDMEDGCRVESLSVLASDTPNLSKCSSLKNMFANTGLGISESIKDWDVSTITDMSGMFIGTGFNEDISSWDVSNVNNMAGMFSGGETLTGLSSTWQRGRFNQDVSSWDVKNVNNMSGMFTSCDFNQDISSWDVSNVESMSNMFRASTFNQDISNWDVSNVTNMAGMFSGLDTERGTVTSNFNQNISSWNVGNVTNMSSMFSYTENFDQNLSNWDVFKVKSMVSMFESSSYNKDISSWNVSSVRNMSNMFNGSSFNQDISIWDVSNVMDMSYMFAARPDFGSSWTSSFNQDLSNWNVNNVTSCEGFNVDTVWVLSKPNFTNCNPD